MNPAVTKHVARTFVLVSAFSVGVPAFAQLTLTSKEITDSITRSWDIHFDRLVDRKLLPPAKALPKLTDAQVVKCEPVGTNADCVIKITARYRNGKVYQADYPSRVRNADEIIGALVSGAVENEVRDQNGNRR